MYLLIEMHVAFLMVPKDDDGDVVDDDDDADDDISWECWKFAYACEMCDEYT